MPTQRPHSLRRGYAPADRLARAISSIDQRLEHLRLTNQPLPLNTYRARRILQEAHARCREQGDPPASPSLREQTARTGVLPKPHRPRRDPVERYEALPGPLPAPSAGQDFRGCLEWSPEPDLRFRKCDCGAHAYEGKTMAYDWTGETTRKRNRVKLATAVFLSLAIVLGIPAVVTPLL